MSDTIEVKYNVGDKVYAWVDKDKIIRGTVVGVTANLYLANSIEDIRQTNTYQITDNAPAFIEEIHSVDEGFVFGLLGVCLSFARIRLDEQVEQIQNMS